jgi:hypothetical protein
MSSIYTYMWSIFASNSNNPKEEGRDLPKHRDVQWREPLLMGAANKNFKPNTNLRGPKEGQLKKGTPYASFYIKKIIMKD